MAKVTHPAVEAANARAAWAISHAYIQLKVSFELFDPEVWRRMFYNDVDLDAIDWADEMRKLPGQFTQRLYFPGSPDQQIIAEAVYELTGATL
ncbi:Uncharacterised protein [Mycobacteroides abscessus subsp. bolletii]|nr:hypothetical protein [Mycobacteroides abscessus]SHP62335.1 Uncharacterised protein [Mycobacteroides abscessus subsp. bolletii]SHR47453.1 Uncharacterised protein [Mycobacteroides abscessus subsp. bolletii]SHS10738.1 Uncharacterised protein [Mycobacteroides abscessus subsp. bolletii]SHS25244.1 Uncharacterised protein [Mycobacteroides abscessus subsp. bolletii]SHY52851.1 Uncharacterised protein [Mycobacteroides abscessus subsp. bolletii]